MIVCSRVIAGKLPLLKEPQGGGGKKKKKLFTTKKRGKKYQNLEKFPNK